MAYYELQPEYQCSQYITKTDGQKYNGDWYNCTNIDFCPNLDSHGMSNGKE